AFKKHVLDKMAHAIELRRFIPRADTHPNSHADTGHLRHLRRRYAQAIIELGELVHAKSAPSGESFRHDFRRPDAPLIIENNVDGFLRIVGDGEQIEIARADVAGLFQVRFHPLDQTSPMLFAEQNQRKFRNALGLHEREDLEKFIERAETAGHKHEADAVFYKTDFPREEIMEMDRQIGVAISSLLMR